VAVIRMMGEGVEDATGELPLTSAAERVLERARNESAGEPVRPEGILLALIHAQDGAATRILRQLEADPAEIRSTLSS
jgi:ATP-dependent Clp protease ATP-binding subunit ClpA